MGFFICLLALPGRCCFFLPIRQFKFFGSPIFFVAASFFLVAAGFSGKSKFVEFVDIFSALSKSFCNLGKSFFSALSISTLAFAAFAPRRNAFAPGPPAFTFFCAADIFFSTLAAAAFFSTLAAAAFFSTFATGTMAFLTLGVVSSLPLAVFFCSDSQAFNFSILTADAFALGPPASAAFFALDILFATFATTFATLASASAFVPAFLERLVERLRERLVERLRLRLVERLRLRLVERLRLRLVERLRLRLVERLVLNLCDLVFEE